MEHSSSRRFAPTLRDVADATGLSISTVSRALAHNARISASTVERVRAAAEAIGYQPNIQARSLRNATSTMLGLAIPSLTNPYFAELAEAVQERAVESQLTVVIGNTQEDPDQLDAVLRGFIQLRVRGLIVVPHEDKTSEIENLPFPTVLVDRQLPDTHLPCVDSDPLPGIRDAVSTLVTAGHKRIGYLSGPAETSTGRERLAAFRSVSDGDVVRGGYNRSDGRRASAELLARGCTAIIAGDSMMTIGALETCLERGLVVGEDLSLIGFDDFPVFALQPHPLTIINQHVRSMGWRAVDVLLNAAEPTRIPTDLVVRESTRSHHAPR